MDNRTACPCGATLNPNHACVEINPKLVSLLADLMTARTLGEFRAVQRRLAEIEGQRIASPHPQSPWAKGMIALVVPHG